MQPRGTIRPRKAEPTVAAIVVEAETPRLDLSHLPADWMAGIEVQVPPDWLKGQLLNIRNNGAEYVVTLLGEEFDPRYPHRALKFPNSVACQAFVSSWYAREHSDPRAF